MTIELSKNDRVKGAGADTPTCSFPINMGTVLENDGWNAKVRWDTGEVLWHLVNELKRI